MGTVGLSFGSATSGAGFNVSTTVASILSLQQGIESPWKTQLTTLGNQQTAFSTLGTDLSTLSTSLQTLTDFDGVLSEKEGSSSNNDVISLSSADATATAGSHQILVSALAQTSSYDTDSIGANDTLSGSITIQVGTSGTPQTINVVSGSSDTLSTLAAAINSANIGVQASVISDQSGSRLALVSGTGGSAGQLTVTSNLSDTTANDPTTGTSSIGVTMGEKGQDASFTVDGVAMTSASNTISTAIPGVTFDLLSTSSTAVQVQIENDVTDMSTAMSDFVSAYNQVVKDMTAQEGNDASGNAEPLFGDPTLSLMQSTLSQALFGGAASGSISNITQLGITVNDDGSLTYSASDFETAVNSDFSDVVGFFQNTGSFGSNFTTALDGLSGSSTTGAIYLAEQQISVEESTLNTNISNEEALLATESSSLTTELNTANETLQSIPSQLNEVNEMYSSISGYNENSE